MYGAAKSCGVDAIVAVSDGDCSHTRSLLEILKHEGMEVIPFAYPYDRDAGILKAHIEKFAKRLGATFARANEWMANLDRIRRKLAHIDSLTWKENRVTGFENHLLLVSSSDFDGNPDAFEERCDKFIEQAEKRDELPQKIRLAFIGVPPIFPDIYHFFEERGARVVFNEVQRQFSFPYAGGDIVERYLKYTYPYDVAGRIDDIKREIDKRGIDGIIHYVQSFCHRQMEDVMLRKALKLPFLTVEGDAPQPLDARTKLRIESFCEMLQARTEAQQAERT